MKKNKTTVCIKCGKELSEFEKKKRKRTCEHCANKNARTTRNVLGVVGPALLLLPLASPKVRKFFKVFF